MSISINKDYISRNNINGTGNPCEYIVIHETDNTNKGAGAKTHANAQHKGHFTDMSVHYYCGDDGVFQAAEHTCKCWHVGRTYVSNPNVPGCTNNNSIGIEICVNSDGDYNKARRNAIELVKHLIQTTGIPASRVIRHYDAKGKYCPRKMLDNPSLWTDFKNQIGNTTSTTNPGGTQDTTKYYRVGTGWSNGVCTGQIGAYTILENAKASCLAGYKVYDWDGNVVYENKTTGTQASAFKGLTETQAAAKCLEICREDAKATGILASVTAAQMILESGYVTTELAVNANNCFGMKCSLSGNTWSGSSWDGSSKYTKETKEQDAKGNEYTVTADFRKYATIELSIADHSAYLLGAMNGSVLRYKGLTAAKDYKSQITIIKNGGYATDVNYINKICSIIERFSLNKYDSEQGSGTQTSSQDNIKAAQVALNRSFGSNLVIDGIWGTKSQTAWNKALQIVLNTEYNAGLAVDGIVGTKTKAAIRNVKYGDNNLLVGVLQIGLYARNLTTGSIDCSFGDQTEAAVIAFQKSAGLTADAIAGKNTFTALSK